jgi:hypothetical protein
MTMLATATTESEGLFEALASLGRSPEIPESADCFGWFVGAWELDIRRYWSEDVTARGIKGEVRAAWALEGRAVQDVWIMPRRTERRGPPDKHMNMYGTTLRVWDPTIEAWRITWINPAGDHYENQIGRWSGKDVVQVGARPDGTPTRWRFIDITPESFHWLGEALAPDGKTWKVEGDFFAARTPAEA